jgi:hypothetical protein
MKYGGEGGRVCQQPTTCRCCCCCCCHSPPICRSLCVSASNVHCNSAPSCRSLCILMTLCVERAAQRRSPDAAFAPRAARRQGSFINAQRGGWGMRSFGVPDVPCHACPCGWARRSGVDCSTSGSCGFCPLKAGRELILCTSGSRGFFPLGASQRFAWR